MFNKTKRLLALLLALALVFSLAGCAKDSGNGDDEYSIVYEEEYEYVDGGSGDKTSSGDKTTSGDKTSSGDKPQESTGKVDPEKYRGTTVKFASTIDPKNDFTQYVLDSFTAKYGINVEIVACSLPGYITEMTGLINSGKAPDVGRSNGDYPGFMGYFDSLDKAKIDFEDPIWNKTTFALSTFNGVPYMCDTYGCYWTEVDIVAYSKKGLQDAGCELPADLYKKGEWCWDKYVEIAQQTAEFYGKPVVGPGTNEAILHTLGGSIYKIKDEKIVSGLDSKTKKIIADFAKLWDKQYFTSDTTNGIVGGTSYMTICHAWSLRKDGDLKTGQWADLGFTFLPAATKGGETPSTGIFRGFGIMKGAANPVGGGLFLRWYLDVNNYDTDNAFLNEDAKNFFFDVTTKDFGANYNPYLTYIGLNDDVSGVKSNDIYRIMRTGASNVETGLSSVEGNVNKGVKNLNKYIEENLNAH